MKVPPIRRLLALVDDMHAIVKSLESLNNGDPTIKVAATMPTALIKDWADQIKSAAVDFRDETPVR